jgi:3-methylcrotonyl-CoA carboxylase alpha subunit
VSIPASSRAGAITPYYDPMIAKMIAHAPTREAALDKLAAALEHTIAAGPHTNLALLAALCRADEFRAGTFDTGFIERNLATLGGGRGDRAAAAFGAVRLLAREAARIAEILDRPPDAPASPWDATDGFQLAGVRATTLPLLIDGEPVDAHVTYGANGPTVAVDGVPAALDATAIEAADASTCCARAAKPWSAAPIWAPAISTTPMVTVRSRPRCTARFWRCW